MQCHKFKRQVNRFHFLFPISYFEHLFREFEYQITEITLALNSNGLTDATLCYIRKNNEKKNIFILAV